MDKIGIYGGSFAPIHNGHIRAAREFIRQFSLDELLIVPNGAPPHKKAPVGDNITHRLNMLKLVFDTPEYKALGIRISKYELDRREVNYTVDTLRHYHNENKELYFLCGTDMLLTMHRWRKPMEIARLCTLVYARREDRDPILEMQLEEQVLRLKECFGFTIKELSMPPLQLSSTQIRHAHNKRLYVPEAVADYIEKNNLYV